MAQVEHRQQVSERQDPQDFPDPNLAIEEQPEVEQGLPAQPVLDGSSVGVDASFHQGPVL